MPTNFNMAKAKAKSKKVNAAPILLHNYPYTFEQLHWGERMLHYIANDMETDYNKLASMHTYLLTTKDVPDLFQAFYKWVKALWSKYELKEAMEIYGNRYRDCMKNRDPHSESQGEMMRLAFHATFPDKTIEGVKQFSRYSLDIQFEDGGLVNIHFDANSDEEATDAVLQAYLDQDENLPDDKFWKPEALKFEGKLKSVDISQGFFDRANGLVEPPQSHAQQATAPWPQAKLAKPSLPKLPVDAQDSDDDDDDSHEALARQIINICNSLKDDIDADVFVELAKELNLD